MDLSKYYTEDQVRYLLGYSVYLVNTRVRDQACHVMFGRKLWYIKEDIHTYAEENFDRLKVDRETFESRKLELASKAFEITTDEWLPVNDVLRVFPFSRQRLSQLSQGVESDVIVTNGNNQGARIRRIRVNNFWLYNVGDLKDYLTSEHRLRRINEEGEYKTTEYGSGYETFSDWKSVVESW